MGFLARSFVANKKDYSVPNRGGWFNIYESFGGAWQQGVTVDPTNQLLAFSGIFAPLTLIASDISKLRIKLMRETNGISKEVIANSPWLPVLRKPNKYQNRIKFVEQWIVSKFLHGNTYALKVRDARGIVIELYILDAMKVKPLVADDGSVYYQLSVDNLSGIFGQGVVVPASEIIHDMMVSLWHPLCGVSPLYASAMSATQGRRIQNNSSKFFDNMSRPSGMLTAPDTIADETALRLKLEWETNFSGANLGKMAVLGDGLKYEAMTIPAEQAQLIEQLEWTSRDIAACFHMPLFKVGGPVPANHTIEALNLQYYSDCLQSLIEQLELCLNEGLKLPPDTTVEMDTEQLARMDTAAQIDTLNKAVGGGWMSPNEARAARNMEPVDGGDSPMIQQQNYSLSALAKRDAKDDPFGTAKPTAPASEETPKLPAPVDATGPSEEDSKRLRILELESEIATRDAISAMKKTLQPLNKVITNV